MNIITPAIIVLNQNSVTLARQIASIFPDSTIYGLANRTYEVDVSFNNFGDTLRELFTNHTPIIGICAAGILIRTLAPLLNNKWHEPPVLAIAEDGSAVVPLLGGLHGVNDLARSIAEVLNVSPAITTTGDIRFGTTLLSPPSGYHLANPDDAKKFISDLLSGATVKLEDEAPWLQESKLPITTDGKLTIKVTEKEITLTENCLVYHPKNIVIGLDSSISKNPQDAIALLQKKLTENKLSSAAIAGIFVLDTDATHPGINSIAQAFKVPVRLFDIDRLNINKNIVEALVFQAVGETGRLIVSDSSIASGAARSAIALAVADSPIDIDRIGKARGKLAIVGTGPGSENWMSPEVKKALQNSTDWVGYKTYLDLVEPLRKNQKRHESDNRVEIERAKAALELAATGRSVAVVSSGDPGIFAMAAAVFEVIDRENKPQWDSIDIKVCPGISAMQAAAAQIGAPLGHDFCAISLSDILKPWSIIEERIAVAAKADFAIAFYNPGSKQRTWQIEKAREILLRWRSPQTTIILARNLGRLGQSIEVKTLDRLTKEDVSMQTIVLVGSSQTKTLLRKDGNFWVYTPRQYQAEKS
jgi:cobalt-precorrin 5A hydrolase / precorrin-3B C17-methyltransferase